MIELTACQLGKLLQGKVEGDATTIINKLATIAEAKSGAVSFIDNTKYEPLLYTTKASVVIIAESLQLSGPVSCVLIRVANPYLAFAKLLDLCPGTEQTDQQGISEQAYLDQSTQIGKDVNIGAFAYLASGVIVGEATQIHPQVYIGKDVRIGADCVLFPGVKILAGSVLGNRVIVHAGAVIGSDGFGFAPQSDGSYQKIKQIGIVEIGDDVEIGANTCIDRATMGVTHIAQGVKIDNLVQIAHNVRIGAHCAIAAQAGIAGSSVLGKNCLLGGQVGIVGHLNIADGSQINAQSGVNKSLATAHEKWHGTPAGPYLPMLKAQAALRNLPNLAQQVAQLERLVAALVSKPLA